MLAGDGPRGLDVQRPAVSAAEQQAPHFQTTACQPEIPTDDGRTHLLHGFGSPLYRHTTDAVVELRHGSTPL